MAQPSQRWFTKLSVYTPTFMIDRTNPLPLSVLRRLPKWAFAIDREQAARTRPLLLRRGDAAQIVSMSIDSFERYVQPDIKIVIKGRLKLIPYSELERWVGENAVKIGGVL